MEYAPLTWMSSARCHLNLLLLLHGHSAEERAERLISGTLTITSRGTTTTTTNNNNNNNNNNNSSSSSSSSRNSSNRDEKTSRW